MRPLALTFKFFIMKSVPLFNTLSPEFIGMFYCVTLWDNQLILQGDFSKELLRECREQIPDTDFKVCDEWIKSNTYIEGIKVDITLT